MHTWGSIAITSPWLVTNLTMYGTPLTCAVTFIIGGVKLAKLGPLAIFHAQLVGLAAWQVLGRSKNIRELITDLIIALLFKCSGSFGIWQVWHIKLLLYHFYT